jgi:hypothetical protein
LDLGIDVLEFERFVVVDVFVGFSAQMFFSFFSDFESLLRSSKRLIDFGELRGSFLEFGAGGKFLLDNDVLCVLTPPFVRGCGNTDCYYPN